MLKRRWQFALLIVALLALLAFLALDPSVRADPRRFDPDAVARADAKMWRDYYEKRRLSLFLHLTALLHAQYGLSWGESLYAAVEASRAAFTFKDGHSRSDYEKARPRLERFYRIINKRNQSPFDPDRAARLELAWWIAHRERESLPAGTLARALAAESAEIYHVAPARLTEYAELRARAMMLRDETADHGGTQEADWTQIDKLLQESWRSLHRAVNAPENRG